MKDIAKYLYEVGQLKRVKRSGWWMAGISNPESIAEHSFRTAILGYILASLEECNPMKTATICLFHDVAEARINDFHRVAKRYVDSDAGEAQASKEQLERLPTHIAENIATLINDYEERETPEGRLAHDADLLECLIQAREYQAQGYADVQDWITNCRAGLKSDSAKCLAEDFLIVEPHEWWSGLKKIVEVSG